MPNLLEYVLVFHKLPLESQYRGSNIEHSATLICKDFHENVARPFSVKPSEFIVACVPRRKEKLGLFLRGGVETVRSYAGSFIAVQYKNVLKLY